MALGSGKKKKNKTKKSDSEKIYFGSVWERENNKGEKFLGGSIDNIDPESEYHKGRLIWQVAESGKCYQVKSFSIYDASDKGPAELLNKLVLDLDNEYHVEELDMN